MYTWKAVIMSLMINMNIYICVAGSEKLKTLKDISDCLKLFKKDYPQEKGYYYSLDFYADIID